MKHDWLSCTGVVIIIILICKHFLHASCAYADMPGLEM